MDIENNQSEKLKLFRALLQTNQIQGYIVPHNDAHDSEYIAAADERLAYISGFTGSAGFAFVSLEEAYLWTDSRYFLQADKQLEKGWELKKMVPGYQTWFKFVEEKYSQGYKVGFDPLLMNSGMIDNVNKVLSEKQIELVALEQNLVDKIWENKPQEPKEQVFIHEEKWHNYPFFDKYEKVQKLVQEKGGEYYLTAKLDEIAWVLNLRGNDITFNPVFKSYLVLNFDKKKEFNGILYVDQDKIDKNVEQYLESISVEVKKYDQVFEDLKNISRYFKVAFQPTEINRKLFENINSEKSVVLPSPTPICILKSQKNSKEIEGFTNCHIRDGSALVSYFAWLEDQLVNQKNTELNEHTAALVLEKKRRALDSNLGLSFDTISSIGANGAIVHYKPDEENSAKLSADEMYLCDSGGQYYDGTTDVTRTVHFGTPSQEQKDAYTRVLLGNQDLRYAIWPKKNNIAGSDLDVLARRHLWQNKMDYGHGTGHGVGFFLNVHEGPQGISKLRTVPLKEGMLVTDEPGYYKSGEYGIRIEDVLAVVDVGDEHLGFQNFTQCPYDQNLIDLSLLSKRDADNINRYHQEVYNNLAPILEKNNDQLALNWLKKHTKTIVL